MKRLKLNVSPHVERQILQPVLFIATDSVENALSWEDRLRVAMEKLTMSHGDAIDEEGSARLGSPVRKLVFEKTYLIHYRINVAAGVVEIASFRHGTRLPRTDEP